MTKKEKIHALLNKQIPEPIPYHCNLTLKIKDMLADHYGIQRDEVENHVGNHLLYVNFQEPIAKTAKKIVSKNEKHQGGTYSFRLQKTETNELVDEFGISWNNSEAYETGDWGMIDHPVKNMKIGDYRFPDPKAEGRFRDVEKIVQKNPGRFNVLLMIGLFDTAWHVTGIEDLLLGMAMTDTSFANNILDAALEFNIGIIEEMPDCIEGVRFMEDWGQQKGLLMGLPNWKKYLKPRLKEMYNAVKKKGCAVMSHSCGDIMELLPELIELGVDILDPIQPEVMDIESIKKEYGKDIILFGGLGCQSTIPLGTPEAVVDEAKSRIEILGKDGGYILGSAGSIPTDAPIDNVVALFEYCKSL